MKNSYPCIRPKSLSQQLAGIFSRTLFVLNCLIGCAQSHHAVRIFLCVILFVGFSKGSEQSRQAHKKRMASSELMEPSLEKKSKPTRDDQEISERSRNRVVEYAPEFPLLKNSAEGLANRQAVAVYLQLKNGEKEGHTDVEWMLSAVQSSSLALFGRPFFELGDPANSMKLAKITWGEEDFSVAHRMHVDNMGVLIKRMGAHEPLDNSPLDERYFQQPKVWLEYLLLMFEQAKTSDEVTNLIAIMRSYISYRSLLPEDLVGIKDSCLQNQASIERILKLWTSLSRITWPHQNSSFEAFMGYLVFPLQCEGLFEPTARLRSRGHLQDLLSCSASWGNLLATVHLAHILAEYDPRSDESMKDVVSVYCDAVTKKRIEGATKKPSSGKSMPHYLCGLLCIERNKNQQAHDHFKMGHEKGDGWCTYRCALNTKDPQRRRALVEVLRQREPGLALLMEAKSIQDPYERIRLLCEAGKVGIAQGYLSAGILAKALNDEAAKEYFLLAGQKYLLSGYEEAARFLRDTGDLEEMIEAYRLQGIGGDPHGHVQLAQQLWNENRVDEAMSSGEQGGILGYDKLIELEPHEKKRKMLVEKRSELQRTRFALLKGSIVHDD